MPWVNTLDYTAVVVPISKVDSNIDKAEKDYHPLNEKDRLIWEQCMYVSVSEEAQTKICLDDPEVQHGTPTGLQFVGRRFQEEKMIALAEMFEKAFALEQGITQDYRANVLQA